MKEGRGEDEGLWREGQGDEVKEDKGKGDEMEREGEERTTS